MEKRIDFYKITSAIETNLSKGEWMNALILATASYTGLRNMDYKKLKWQDVGGDKLVLVESKTQKRREIPIGESYLRVLNICRANIDHKDAAYMFPRKRGGKPGKFIDSRVAWQAMLNAALRSGGVTEEVGLHTTRRAFGRQIWENKGSNESALVLLSKIFNHRDISTTRLYLGFTGEEITSAYSSL